MALFGGRSEERKKRAESLIDMSKDPSLAEELGELAASGSRREIDRAGSEVQQAVTEAKRADIRQIMMIEHGRCPECQGRTDNYLFTVVCPSCGWYRREQPNAGKTVLHLDDGASIACDRIYRVAGDEFVCVANGVVVALAMRRHIHRIEYQWTECELSQMRERSRKLRTGICYWCEKDRAEAEGEEEENGPRRPVNVADPPAGPKPLRRGEGPTGPFEDYVAFGVFQERYVFCSEACMVSFRKRYPSRVHRNCYETDCRTCDKCAKRYDVDGFRRRLL